MDIYLYISLKLILALVTNRKYLYKFCLTRNNLTLIVCLEVHCNDGSNYELRVDRKIPLYPYPTNETYLIKFCKIS